MQPLSPTVRTHNLSALGSNHYDVLVIGGGITGAGVALDAVARGYKVALVEKADFASGTSSRSTKLVHGGIRYLPNMDIALVHEALVERGLLLQNAPFLVSPVAFVLPIYEGDRHPVGMPFTTPGGIGLSRLLDIGLWMYDLMAGKRRMHWHQHLSREKVLELGPALLPDGLKEGFTYYDAQTNDARLTMALINTAAQFGATIVNYAEVTNFVMEDGKVVGADVRDTLLQYPETDRKKIENPTLLPMPPDARNSTRMMPNMSSDFALGGQTVTVSARHFINATGVYAEKVERLTGEDPQIVIEPSKGIHLVFTREALMLRDDAALVLPETEDKRILFIVPWESRAIFGTTDTGSGDLDHPMATAEDIAYLLKYLNRYLTVHIGEEDIISAYAGYRPLVKPGKAGGSTAKLSRTHVVMQGDSGLVSVMGGKLTTYRRMAQDAVDVLNRRDGTQVVHPTQSLPLQGSAGWPVMKRELERRGRMLGWSAAVIEHLGHSYGTAANVLLESVEQDPALGEQLIPDLPYIKAEVLYACRYEMAMTPYDVLARRTSIILEDRQRGGGVVQEVGAMMAREHGWSEAQQKAMINSYLEEIQGSAVATKV